jgi:FkbM family methyltransferase
MGILRSFAIQCAKRGRMYANQRGYDFHAVDASCWDDQIALLQGRQDVVIFDVGANVGSIAAHYRKLFPDCRLYGFEPQEECFGWLEKRFSGDPAVSVYQAAVGAAPGKAQFHLTAGRDSSSLLGAGHEHAPPHYRQLLAIEEVREVEVVTLDDFTEEHAIERIDILKMDIQGGECSALQGAARLLAGARISLLYLEVCLMPLYANHPLMGDVAKSLARYDYTFHLSYNPMINGRSGRTLWCDAIFVSPQLYGASREQLKKGWIGSA